MDLAGLPPLEASTSPTSDRAVRVREPDFDRAVSPVRRVVGFWLAAAALAGAMIGLAFLCAGEDPPEIDRVRYGKEWRPEIEAPTYEREPEPVYPRTYSI